MATRAGHFVQVLMNQLQSYSEIIGIDLDGETIETAHQNLACDQVRFIQMNAEHLAFQEHCFDTVTISASLHHLVNIRCVLGEMVRVLKPGGQFLLFEMHCDGQSGAELTTVYLHHWIADIDTELGGLHQHTLPRQMLVDYVTALGLGTIKYYDAYDHASDPLAPHRLKELDHLIEQTLHRAEGTKNYRALAEQGQALRQRLHQVGARREPRLFIVGES